MYFYDNGIRNAIIKNFNPLDLRQDKGALWENFLVSERKKYLANRNLFADLYFWRTRNQQEIDLVEVTGNDIKAYEFKWQTKRKYKLPGAFREAYPESEFQLINQENYLDFLI
ncbi:MAG: DUF4143 domain-containing protein [Candidatus Stygibacter frigidus]|nr:DUF4143 domain-containing protein [Candidatus Stygibacter frigidus]